MDYAVYQPTSLVILSNAICYPTFKMIGHTCSLLEFPGLPAQDEHLEKETLIIDHSLTSRKVCWFLIIAITFTRLT